MHFTRDQGADRPRGLDRWLIGQRFFAATRSNMNQPTASARLRYLAARRGAKSVAVPAVLGYLTMPLIEILLLEVGRHFALALA